MNHFRYPGAQPFKTEESHVFYGRDEHTVQLHRLVKLEPLVLLYAKSGMGKSSLINAGLIPAVEAEGEFEPLSIRFQAWTPGKAEMPAEITRRAVVPEGSATTFLDKLIADEPVLWHHLKEAQIQGKRKFLLIFDQFEELFTYPEAVVRAFKNDLAEALYAKIPQRYREALEKQIENDSLQLDDQELALLQTPPELRVLMAIRSDRMSLLNSLTDFLPTVLKNCYELPPLSIEGAERAILEPAHSQSPGFISPPFDFAPDAVQKIIGFLTENETERVESTQLQIICQSVERKIKKAGQVVRAEELGDLNAVIENYYYDQLARLGDEEAQLPARRLIEEGLVFEEEERRLSIYEGQIFRTYGISPDTLRQLVDAHLLRAEPSQQGGYTYELAHDTLVAPVLKAKRSRFEVEEKRRALEEQRLREAELAEARRAAEIERRKRRRANVLTAVAMVCFLVAAAAGWWALGQKRAAENANTEANRKLLEALQEKQTRLDLQKDQLARAQIIYQKAEDELLLQETTQAMHSLDSLIRLNRADIEQAEKRIEK